jgi:hypothetical protein
MVCGASWDYGWYLEPVVPGMKIGWNRIIWPNVADKTMADLPSGCMVEDEIRNQRFYPFAKDFLPFPTPFIPTKTYFFSCR